MNPIINQNWTAADLTRWGIRGMDEFTIEELARLRQKVEGWVRQRDPHSERPRRRPWVMMKSKMANPV